MKRFISILLAALMIISVSAVLPASAADSSVVSEGTAIIYSVAVTGVTEPITGAKPVKTADSNRGFRTDAVYWYDYDTRTWMKDDEVFVAGHTYGANIHLQANSGFEFSLGDIAATVNGKEAYGVSSVTMEDRTEWINVEMKYTLPAGYISNVAITGVSEPEINYYTSKNIELEDGYSLDKIFWYNETDNTSMVNVAYEEGKTYSLNLRLKADGNYEFSEDGLNVTVNGKTPDRVWLEENNKMLCVKCDYIPIDKRIILGVMSVTGIVDPVAGEGCVCKVDIPAAVAEETVEWYNKTDDKWMDEGDVFENGKEYTVKVYVTLKKEYKFNLNESGEPYVNARINDRKATVSKISGVDPKLQIVVNYTYSLEATPTETVTEPKETETVTETTPTETTTEPKETETVTETAPTETTTEPKETETTTEPTDETDEPEPELTDISGWEVSGIKDKTYTGNPIRQSIKVTDSGNYAEFETLYSDNINVGTATVTIIGIGEYKGSITKTFKIKKAKNPMTVKAEDKSVLLKALKKKNVTVKNAITVKKNQGAVSYAAVKKGTSKGVSISKKGVITIKKGAAKKKTTLKIVVNVTAKGNKNYKKLTKKVTVKIKVK